MKESENVDFEKCFNPETLKYSMLFTSLFVLYFEALKQKVIEEVSSFYSDTFEIKEGNVSPRKTDKYKECVLNLRKDRSKENDFEACLYWLVKENAISEEECDLALSARNLRNQYLHELASVLLRGIAEEEVKLFRELILIYSKIDNWVWVNVELAIMEPDEIPEGIDTSKVQSVKVEFLNIFANIAINGDDSYYEELKRVLMRGNENSKMHEA